MVDAIHSAKGNSRDDILQAIILAFKYSRLRTVAGTNAFAAMLDEQWESIVVGDVMRLQVVYDLLKRQSGFDADAAVAPLARIKTWEPYLRLRVDLPMQLMGKVPDPAAAAASCQVPPKELSKALPGAAAGLNLNVVAQNSMARLQPVPSGPSQAKQDARKAPWAIMGTVLALLLIAGGAVGYLQLRVIPVDVNTVSDSIPLQDAHRQGSTLTATLKVPTWVTFPKEDRQAAVLASFNKMRGLGGVDEFRLVDQDGSPIATVRTGNPDPVVEMHR